MYWIMKPAANSAAPQTRKATCLKCGIIRSQGAKFDVRELQKDGGLITAKLNHQNEPPDGSVTSY